MIFAHIRDERGVALPVALCVLFVVAGLATVAARAGIVSTHQSDRDKSAKRAAQAANAGLQTALYQTNLLQPGDGKCVLKDPSTGALSNGNVTSGWCATQNEDFGDGATYQMQVSDAGNLSYSSTGMPIIQRTIVSTGIVNGVRRRAAVSINAATGAPVFPPGYAVAVRDSVDMKNNAHIQGHLGSNGTINLKNNSTVCGNITAGPGKTKIGNNLTQCAGYNQTPMTEPFDLQPVDISRATPNANDRLTKMKNGGTPADSCTSCNKITWSAASRVLTMDGGTLTLNGDTYLFCRFDFKNGTIQIPYRTTPLFIYIDSPESCGSTTGMGSVVMDGTFANLYSPALAIALMVAGSATKTTTVDLPTTDATSPIGVYAPNSAVIQKNNVNFTGAVVAKSLTIMNNANFTWHSSINGLTSGSPVRFYQTATGSYKECTAAPVTTSPSNGC
jgi:type II secretory pathway pseudopilin PulG